MAMTAARDIRWRLTYVLSVHHPGRSTADLRLNIEVFAPNVVMAVSASAEPLHEIFPDEETRQRLTLITVDCSNG